jgi:hypothetical protein
VSFPNTLPFRIPDWDNLVDSHKKTLQLFLGEFKSPFSFRHDDKGEGAGGVLQKMLAFNLSVKSTLISESRSTVPRGPPTCTHKCEIYT